MKIIKHHSTVYSMQFKKVKLWIDHNLAIFLNCTNNDCLNLSSISNDFLLKKFDLYDWDDIGENLLHIKFLVKYSPILSKFIDLSEFNEIEFCNPDLSINKRYCLKINDKNIFSTRDLDYERIGIQMDPYLKELLMQEDSIQW